MKVREVYLANREFKYDGRAVSKDEEWTPGNGRWDDKIRNSGLVRLETRPVEDGSAPDYTVYSNRQLREKLKTRGLPVYGKKSDLIRRLQESDEDGT